MSNVIPMQTAAPIRARDYAPEQLALIRRTVAADATADEFNMFMEVARRAGLDPFRKQLYCLVYNKDKADKRKVAFITGIDGARAVAARNRDYRPDDAEPVIVTNDAAKDPETNPQGIVKATVRAYKLAPNGEWHAVVGVAHWEEFAPLREVWAENEQGKYRPTGRFELDRKGNWYRMPKVMLVKCAEMQALRKGWPEDLSGIYSPEEFDQEAARDITASVAVEQHEQEKRLRLVNARDTIPILWTAGEPIQAVPLGQFADRALEWLGKAESATQVEAWRRTNIAGLNEFWARQKSDALALKAAMEKRIQELSQ